MLADAPALPQALFISLHSCASVAATAAAAVAAAAAPAVDAAAAQLSVRCCAMLLITCTFNWLAMALAELTDLENRGKKT